MPIDNNSVERLMKQVAMGRKAWLFVSNLESGEQSAMLMRLVSSAKRHDLDVWTYLKDELDLSWFSVNWKIAGVELVG